MNSSYDPGSRQRALLREMGIGPLWRLRVQETPVTAEMAAPAPMENPMISQEIAGAQALQERAPDLSVVPAVQSMPWEQLQATVATCRACGLCEGRANTVFGSGDRQARWLFVGEGPGYNENLQGQPFVGAAGQLLDNMLRALGLQRGQQAYIANIVKCRPTDGQGKDRAPSAQEIAACLPYLQRQIALIQPEVIVALGKTAAIALLGLEPETALGQLRGKLHRYQEVPVVVTYHPAYLLRKPADKSKTWADLCLALKALTTP